MPDSTPNQDPQREAFERGRRQAHVDGELEQHERRLNAINGSIDRTARNVGALRDTVEEVRDEVGALASQLATRVAVEASRNEELKKANEQQISNRTFWLGVAAIIATVLAAVISVHGGL